MWGEGEWTKIEIKELCPLERSTGCAASCAQRSCLVDEEAHYATSTLAREPFCNQSEYCTHELELVNGRGESCRNLETRWKKI